MKSIRSFVVLPALAAACILASAGSARADEVLCSSFPGGVVTGDVNANLIVDCDCIIAPGALVNGNIDQADPGAGWNITVEAGADVNGNIDEYGSGTVRITVGDRNLFDGSVWERGTGDVIVRILPGGLFNGNVQESGRGDVLVRVQGPSLFNGNTYERNRGNLSTSGTGAYNGTTKESGPGTCVNLITNFNGSPCE